MKPYDAAQILEAMQRQTKYRPNPMLPKPAYIPAFDPSHITEHDDKQVKSRGHIGFFGDWEAFEGDNGTIYVSKRKHLFLPDGQRSNRRTAGHIKHMERSLDHIRRTYGKEHR